jgi:hypothetical protein
MSWLSRLDTTKKLHGLSSYEKSDIFLITKIAVRWTRAACPKSFYLRVLDSRISQAQPRRLRINNISE